MPRGTGSTAIREATRKLRGRRSGETTATTTEATTRKPMTPNAYWRSEMGKFCTYLVKEGCLSADGRQKFITAGAAYWANPEHRIDFELTGWGLAHGEPSPQGQTTE